MNSINGPPQYAQMNNSATGLPMNINNSPSHAAFTKAVSQGNITNTPTYANYSPSQGNFTNSPSQGNFTNSPSQANISRQSYSPYHQPLHQSERIMSSSIIGEESLHAPPEETVQYIEVPVIEEVIRHVPKREIVEIEKRVPRYEYEWVEKIVEVPQIQYVDKHVEVPQLQEIVRHVAVKQIVQVPKEVIRYVPKVETRIVEREIEVMGDIIEVPKPYLVENKIVVPHYIDREVPTVVAQKLHPIITESETDFVDVELKEYNPQLIPVDVYIPRPVGRHLIAAGKYEEHRVVDVPPAQFNALVKNLNTHLTDKDADSVYVKLADGTIPMLHGAGTSIVPPTSDDWQKYHHKGQLHVSYSAGLSTGQTAVSQQVYTGPAVVSPAGGSFCSPTSNSAIHTTGPYGNMPGGVTSVSNSFSTPFNITRGGLQQQVTNTTMTYQNPQTSTSNMKLPYGISQNPTSTSFTMQEPRSVTPSPNPITAGA